LDAKTPYLEKTRLTSDAEFVQAFSQCGRRVFAAPFFVEQGAAMIHGPDPQSDEPGEDEPEGDEPEGEPGEGEAA
jgi:hypothetical protein